MLGLNNWIPPLPQPTCYFGFEFFEFVNFCWEKNGKNNANSRKNVNNKSISKNLKSKISKKKGYS
jgi:hypothetical protein